MNFFNRVMMVLLLLWGVVLSIFFIFAALVFPAEMVALVTDLAGALSEGVTVGLQILIASIAALTAIVCFVLLLLELMPRTNRGVKLTGVTGASAELTIDSVVDRIRYEAEGVPSVRQARPSVTSRGNEIDVDLLLRTDPSVDASAKTDEVSQVVRDTVENKLGIRLRRLKVFVQYEPFPKNAKGTRVPQQPAASETSSSEQV